MVEPNKVDFQRLQEDWMTIWQSELAAKAVDREVLEGMAITARSWSIVLAAFQELMHADKARNAGQPSDPEPEAGSGTASGPSPAGDAPGAGEPEIERLRKRVAELERRLAESG